MPFSDYLLDLGAFDVPVLLRVVLDCTIRAELAHLFCGLLKVALCYIFYKKSIPLQWS